LIDFEKPSRSPPTRRYICGVGGGGRKGWPKTGSVTGAARKRAQQLETRAIRDWKSKGWAKGPYRTRKVDAARLDGIAWKVPRARQPPCI
jgi:hypothetical protein